MAVCLYETEKQVLELTDTQRRATQLTEVLDGQPTLCRARSTTHPLRVAPPRGCMWVRCLLCCVQLWFGGVGEVFVALCVVWCGVVEWVRWLWRCMQCGVVEWMHG
jgi:hypothetical protein